MEAAITLFVILVALSTIVFTVWNHQRRKEVWTQFGERNGLHSDGESIRGEVRDVQLEIYTETRGSGKNKSTYTIFEATCPESPPVVFHLYREGMLSKLGKMFGGEDIEVGIPEIDSALIIKGADADRTRSYLCRPDVSRGLTDLIEASRDLEVYGDTVKLEFPGAMADDARMQTTLKLLVDGTRAVAGLGYGALRYDENW